MIAAGCVYKSVMLFAVTVILSGCQTDESGEDVVGAYSCGGVHPIETNQDANYVASHIIQRIEDAVNEIPEGVYRNYMVSGIFGTMDITGVISRTVNESCGANCISRYNNHEIVARMENYASATSPTVITGDINYSDTTGLQITNGSSTTIGAISIMDNGTNISYERVYVSYDCDPVKNGIIDRIISISSSGETSLHSDQSGEIISTGGTFIF